MITRLPKGARQGVVLLHGRGGSAGDILSLLDDPAFDNVAAIAPEAPGRSWWPTSFLAPAAVLAPHLDHALAQVAEAVERLKATGLPDGSIWLCGFSQGACLALEAYARQGGSLAGVIAFSGGLLGLSDKGSPRPDLNGYADKDLSYGELRTGRAWLSVHQIDPHIPLARAKDSAAALRAIGTSTDLHIAPGTGHTVTAEDLAAFRRLLLG